MLYLNSFKTESSTISSDLLEYLKKKFKLSVFIETGTFLGDTTRKASYIFDKVHSIELSKKLFENASYNLSDLKNVHLYHGDSSDVLPRILNTEKRDILFWLDGHFSEGDTALGTNSTPIINEINAIYVSNLENFIILIDDIRIFQKEIPSNPISLRGYPDISEIYEITQKLFPDSVFKIIGDIAIIVRSRIKASFSSIIDAITLSRLDKLKTIQDFNLYRFEKNIANANENEKSTILNLSHDYISTEKYGIGAHFRLWKALILAKEGEFANSLEELLISRDLGLSRKRFSFYESIISGNNSEYFNVISKMKTLNQNDLFFEDNHIVNSPDDLLIRMSNKEIFSISETIVFAGVHKYQEKSLFEKIFPYFKKVILIEPIKEIAQQLENVLSYDERYIVVNAALSNFNGFAEFHITDNDAMSSSLLELGNHSQLFPYVKETNIIQVETITLEKVLKDNNLISCDALILDVQGAEYQILSSIDFQILKDIKFIYSEVSKIEIYKNAKILDDIMDLLADHFVFAGYAANTNDVRDHGNALFINYSIANNYYPYLKNPKIFDSILVATSIAPNKIDEQVAAIDSWVNLGFKVISINTQDEINAVSQFFPKIEFVVAKYNSEQITGKKHIYFDAIKNALLNESFRNVGIINSDIILRSQDNLISKLIENLNDSMIFGSRTDIEDLNSFNGEKYNWGFDYFFFDKEILSKIPESEFCIGMPWWDYWVPTILINKKVKVKYLENEIAFHIKHNTNYSNDLWIYFAKHFSKLLYPNYYKELINDSQLDVFAKSMDTSSRIIHTAQLLSENSLDLINKKAKRIKIEEIQEKSNIKISVITPSFNSIKYIEDTIKSVSNQSFKNYEHIIIDGVSIDGTIDIINSYKNLTSIIEQDNGQSEALNKGFKIAKGEIIAWINSDDYYYDNSVFQKVVDYFESNPTAKVLIGNCLFKYNNIKPDYNVTNQALNFEIMLRYWKDLVPPTQPSIFFKRELFDEFGYLDEGLNYAMDYDFWMRISQQYDIHYINETLSVYRFMEESKSGLGDDWSHFYPEWHKVYMKYKDKSNLIPKQPLITIIFPIINDSEYIQKLNRSIDLIQSQIVKDLEILLISDFDCENEIIENENYIINMHLVKVKTLNTKSFKQVLMKYAKGKAIQCPIPFDNLNPKFYSIAVDYIIDHPNFNIISNKTKSNEFHPILKDDFELVANEIRNKELILHDLENNLNGEISFSVIIPTYNRVEILEKALIALNKQNFDFEDFEVIVVDDGSTDSTKEMIENFDSNFNLSYIHQQNSGPAAARNKGILKAKGKYVLIINDDTIAYYDLLKTHLIYLEKYKNKKVAFLGSFDYTSEAKVKPFTFFLSKTPLVFSYPFMKKEGIYNYRFFWTCNISIAREAIIDAGLFDENFKDPMAEDTELGFRLYQKGFRVIYIPDAKSEHDHSMDIHGFIKRQFMSGKNIVKLFEKHPEILKNEKKVFGFSDLNDKTLDGFRNFINDKENIIKENIKFFDTIEKIEIFNPNFITIDHQNTIRMEELIKVMNKHVWPIHLYHFYSGILYALESTKSLEKVNIEVAKNDIKSEVVSRILAAKDKILIQSKRIEVPNPIIGLDKKELEGIKPQSLKKKILMTMFGWNESGGGTIFPKSVAIELVKQGYEVSVFFSGVNHNNNRPYIIERSVDSGVNLIGIYNKKRDFIMPDLPEYEIEDQIVVDIWKQTIDELKPDLIHYHNFLGLSFAIANYPKTLNIPTVFTPHNYHIMDPELYMINSSLRKWESTDFFSQSELYNSHKDKAYYYDKRFEYAKDLINNKIDKVFAISNRVKELFIDFGVNPDKIDIIYQAPVHLQDIQRAEFNSKSNRLNVGFLGNIIPLKGVHILAGASKIANQNIDFNIYGSGNSNYINELLKISPKLKFHGKYSFNEFNQISPNIDVVVVPSIWEEAAGLVIQESLAMGKPVIGARIGGIPNFIHEGLNGYTYPYLSVNNLANLLNHLSENFELVSKLSNNTKPLTSFHDYIARIILEYEDLIK